MAQKSPGVGGRGRWTLGRRLMLVSVLLSVCGVVINSVLIARGSSEGSALSEILGMSMAFFVVVLLLAGLGRIITNHRRHQYMIHDHDWMSRLGYFMGPYDADGVPGVHAFFRKHSPYGMPPQGYLVATSSSFEIAPTGGDSAVLECPYSQIKFVQLIPGPRRWMGVVSARSAWKLGQVVFTTIDDKRCVFSGTPIITLHTFLVSLGAIPSMTTEPQEV